MKLENPNNDKQQSNGFVKSSSEQQLKISSVLGETCWLLSQSVLHRNNFNIADIEWLVLPAIVSGQFKLYRSEEKPAAIALWAFVSDEVEKKLQSGVGKLTAKEWQSGDNIWLIDVIAPYGKVEEVVADLKKTSLANKVFKYHRNHSDGTREVVTVQT